MRLHLEILRYPIAAAAIALGPIPVGRASAQSTMPGAGEAGTFSVAISRELMPDPDEIRATIRGVSLIPLVTYYPVNAVGKPIAPWGQNRSPGIVFLHGTSLAPDGFYRDLGENLASRGYVVMMPDEHLNANQALLLMVDAVSMWNVLQTRTRGTYNAYESIVDDLVDPDRLILTGHSLGGGAVFPVGSNNQIFGAAAFYDAHFAWGAWAGPYKTAWLGDTINRPFGILIGREDTWSGTPPNNFRRDAYAYFEDTDDFRELKFVYEMALPGSIIEHLTPVIDFGGADTVVFLRSMDICSSFVRAHVIGEVDQFSEVFGPRALAHPLTWRVTARWRHTIIAKRSVADGSGSQLLIYGEPGPVLTYAAVQPLATPIQTPAGPFWLDINSSILLPTLTVPDGRNFATSGLIPRGIEGYFQAFAPVAISPGLQGTSNLLRLF